MAAVARGRRREGRGREEEEEKKKKRKRKIEGEREGEGKMGAVCPLLGRRREEDGGVREGKAGIGHTSVTTDHSGDL